VNERSFAALWGLLCGWMYSVPFIYNNPCMHHVVVCLFQPARFYRTYHFQWLSVFFFFLRTIYKECNTVLWLELPVQINTIQTDISVMLEVYIVSRIDFNVCVILDSDGTKWHICKYCSVLDAQWTAICNNCPWVTVCPTMHAGYFLFAVYQ